MLTNLNNSERNSTLPMQQDLPASVDPKLTGHQTTEPNSQLQLLMRMMISIAELIIFVKIFMFINKFKMIGTPG
jgi:ABC-type lipoprotein release transport system permease subunit